MYSKHLKCEEINVKNGFCVYNPHFMILRIHGGPNKILGEN